MTSYQRRSSSDHLVACVLTPRAPGAVATVSVNGPHSATIVAECFLSSGNVSLERCQPGRILHGRWRTPAGEEVVVCTVDSQRVEIHCHGGQVAARTIVADLRALGAEIIPWPEWIETQENDPLAAAARVALASAPSARTAAILLDQYEGALRREVDSLQAKLLARDISAAESMMDELLQQRAVGMHLTTPFRVVLAGRPNVGKSSLINRLVGFERAIVFDAPGTTRDVVSAGTCLDGWPVELSDTAGMREASDPLEAAGVRKAAEVLATADLVVLVFEASAAWTDDDADLIRRFPDSINVFNKCDLAVPANAHRPDGLLTSAETGAGIETLIAQITRRLVPCLPPAGAAVPFAADHFSALAAARSALDAADSGAALAALRDFSSAKTCK